MKFTRENIDELIQYLQGSCNSLDEGIQTILGDYDSTDLSPENCDQIDNEIFLCTGCGWWCEVSEMSEEDDEQVCVECHNE